MAQELEMDIPGKEVIEVFANQKPEVMIRAGKDITGLSIGERTSALLREDSEAQGALGTFRIENGGNSARVALLLPGIVPSSDITFLKQKQALIRRGYEIISVDYSTQTFRQDVLRVQLGDLINSEATEGKDVSLIALSFGATCAIDFLTKSPEKDTEKVDKVVFVGTIYSFDNIDNPFVNKMARVSHKLTPELLRRSFMPFVKKGFRMDPLYASEFGEDTIRQDLASISSRALAERMKAIADVKSADLLRKTRGIDALFIHWEEDFSTIDSLRNVMALFRNSSFVTIPGRHGLTASSAPEINAQVIQFLNPSTALPQAR